MIAQQNSGAGQGDTARDKFNVGHNQGFGEQNPAFANRPAANYPVPEGPATQGPFPPDLSRNEGTILGVGAAMPLSNPSHDTSQGEQKQGHHGSMPMGPPPLPPRPHPSLLATGQPQGYQHNPQQMPQQGLPQQMPSYPQPPPNMPQLQPPSRMPLLPHPHVARPPPQMSPHNMPPNIPSSMPGSMSMPPTSLPMPMQGPMTKLYRAPLFLFRVLALGIKHLATDELYMPGTREETKCGSWTRTTVPRFWTCYWVYWRSTSWVVCPVSKWKAHLWLQVCKDLCICHNCN